VLSDKGKDIEVVVIDDGSTDKSGEICDRYAAFDSRMTVIHQSNSGVSSARNRGLKEISGKWIWFIDADDYIEPNAFKVLRAIASEENVDTIIAGMYHHFTNRINLYRVEQSYDSKELLLEAISCYQNGMILFSHEIIKQHQLQFSTSIKIGEDLEFQYLYLMHCQHIICCKEAVYHYVVRENSATHNSSSQYNNAMNILDVVDNLFNHLRDNDNLRAGWIGMRINRLLKSGLQSARYLSKHDTRFFKKRMNQILDRNSDMRLRNLKDATIKIASMNLDAYFILLRLYLHLHRR